MMQHDQVTHFTILIDNWGMCLNDRAIHIFRSGGLIVEMLFMLFFVYSLDNGLKISECKAYWLTDFLLINIYAHAKKEFW